MIVKTFSELDEDTIFDKFDIIEKNIEIIKEIQWVNIINYVTVNQKEEEIDILMDYIAGGSLKFILTNFVRFKEKLVRSYTKQILDGLWSCHEKGIYHGDLKSTNILIDDLGIVKLSDFSFIKRQFMDPAKIAKYRKMIGFQEEI